MKTFLTSLACASALLTGALLTGASGAHAAPLDLGETALRLPVFGAPTQPLGLIPVEQARQLSLREVVQIIDARVPGRLSDAQLRSEGGRMVYLIRWEPSAENQRGRIIIFVVDAESGAILSQRGG
jgi:hypothetical protein